MAASATLALKAGVWFRRGRLLIVSPDSLGTACPLSGRNSTYRPVQISAAGSVVGGRNIASRARISVPVPGAANIARLVQHHRREAGLAQPMEKVQAGKSSPNYRDV